MYDIRRFQKALAMIESSNNHKALHDEQQSGIHAGDRAIGAYGLMPNTLNEDINKNKSLAQYKSRLPATENQEIYNKLQNDPKLQDDIAEQKIANMSDDFQTPEEVRYAWRYGPNAGKRKTLEDIKSDKDVMKFMDVYNKIPETTYDYDFQDGMQDKVEKLTKLKALLGIK